ncbi:hypothetical protein FRB94_007682 [Tulasnella sp. JGI-2019a]|nr:hypothetical protein FRB94_007682 [Tulasnella sp. JGI-2019a]
MTPIEALQYTFKLVNIGILLVVGLYYFLTGLFKLLRAHLFIPKFTILADLPTLGTGRTQEKLSGRAIVCGGSIAGLLAAAVCSAHFESVLVVDPDVCTNDSRGVDLPTNIESRTGAHGAPVPVSPRKRVMQWYTPHTYHPVSYMALCQLFPQLQEALDYFGFKPIDLYPKPVRRIGGSEKTSHVNRPPQTLSLSRPAYETLLRRLVKGSRPNVHFVTGTAVTMRRANAPGYPQVENVTIRLDNGTMEEAEVRLVIDATGTTQAGFHKLLNGAGFSVPVSLKDEYNSNKYVLAATFRVPEYLQSLAPIPRNRGFSPGPLFFLGPDASLNEDRLLILTIVEKGQVLVNFSGQNLHSRPHSAAEIAQRLSDFAGCERKVPPWVFDLFSFLEEHEADCPRFFVDAPVGLLNWVKYHAAERATIPKNFIAVGDAVMKVNPLGAHGCSKAMYDAVTLDGCLRKVLGTTVPNDFSSTFFHQQSTRNRHFWRLTKAQDYLWSGTVPVKGETLDGNPLWRKFHQRVLRLCAKDDEAQACVWRINQLLAPPTDLYAPWFLLKLWNAPGATIPTP